ncbi:MAG: GNAT family N-acetyltransferase [Anaerolineae bacterium]|nr:GNAT family N-acetyltransferase [Anaerolineae bacterium]
MQQLPEQITTERLTLRPYTTGDASWYYAMSLRNRAHLAQYEADNPAMSLESEAEAEALMRDFAAAWAGRDYFFLGAFDRQTGAFVAQVAVGPVEWDPPCFEIGYFAEVDHEGRGYVTEAVRGALHWLFDGLDAAWVRLECDDTNVRSWRLAERVGFARQKHLQGAKLQPDGTVTGTLIYGIRREDWVKVAGP